jgi:hypothetical protein
MGEDDRSGALLRADPFGEGPIPWHRRLFARDRRPPSRAERVVGVLAGVAIFVDGVASHGLAARLVGVGLVIAPGWWFARRARARRKREQETILPFAR